MPSKYEHVWGQWYRCECDEVVYIGEDYKEDFIWHEKKCDIDPTG